MNTFRKAAELLPISLCVEALVLPEDIRTTAEEIRLRAGKCMTVLTDGREVPVAPNRIIGTDDLVSVLEKATCASLHAVEHELAQGFISAENGIRIGCCGTGVIKDGELCGLRSFSSLSLRIPHDIVGCSTEIFRKINEKGIKSVLIISPPGFGKTTFLRDYIRNLSASGKRVAVADERGEIAAVCDGVPQFELGETVDVMNGVEKSKAASILLKTMNPEIIAMDEISEEKDLRAVSSAAGCGVKMIASAHAGDISDLKRRMIYRRLLETQMFDYAVVISKNNGLREYKCTELQPCVI